MIINTTLETDDKGDIKAIPSTYKPSQQVKDRTEMVLNHFRRSNIAKTKTYREFDNMTLMERQSTDQYRFNSFQFLDNTLPGEEWKSNAVRPITRNRVISIAAHITGTVMYPQVYARDNSDVDDQGAASVMRDFLEFTAEESKYEQTFTYAVIAMLVNPAVIIQTEYAESYRTVKREKDGKITESQELDEEFSGFQDSIVPLDEFWHPDFYQHDIQKQAHLIRRRVLHFSEAEVKYANNPLFAAHVRPGLQLIATPNESTFYEQYDQNLEGDLVEEIIYWNRNKDLMLTMVNGVMLSDPDQMNPREDKQYPFVKGGFELLDEGKFFYYKSQVNKLGPDEEVIQTLYRMVIDGTYLQLMPPTVVFGDEIINSSMISPGVTTVLKENTKMQTLGVGNNVQAGMNMMGKVEQSITESSIDPQQAGIAGTGGVPTAYEVNRLEQNAKIMLGLFGKMIGFVVRDFADLRINDILQYLTIGEATELSDGIKFRSFLLPDKMVNGKKKSRKIMFDDSMNTEPMTKDAILQGSFDIQQQEISKYDDNMQLVKVHPGLFRERKFQIRVTPEIVAPMSDNARRSMNLEEYDRAINNPLADQQAIYRDLLLGSYETTRDDPDKYIKSATPGPGGTADPSAMGQPGPASGLPKMLLNTQQQKTQSQLMSKPLSAYGK